MNIITTSDTGKKTTKRFLLLDRCKPLSIRLGVSLVLALVALVLWVVYIMGHFFLVYAGPSIEFVPFYSTPIVALVTVVVVFVVRLLSRNLQMAPVSPHAVEEKLPAGNNIVDSRQRQPDYHLPEIPSNDGNLSPTPTSAPPPIVPSPSEQQEERSFLPEQEIQSLLSPSQLQELSPAAFSNASLEDMHHSVTSSEVSVNEVTNASDIKNASSEYVAGPDDSEAETVSRFSPAPVRVPTGESERAVGGAVFSVEKELETRGFRFPKEGSDPKRSADKLDQSYSPELYRAAVTDGVSASFLPSRWAEIIAGAYVKNSFNGPYEFIRWLTNCSAEWYRWTEQEWLLPRMGQVVGVQQEQEYWQREIARGAETTLVGCSFSPRQLQTGEVLIHVDAIGDSNFFFTHPVDEGPWPYLAFPLETADQFGANPDTLPTALRYIDGTWKYMKTWEYLAVPGDFLILATDALAEWILASSARGQDPWPILLKIQKEQEFRAFVEEQRAFGRMQIDDTTMLIIHLKEQPASRPQQNRQFKSPSI